MHLSNGKKLTYKALVMAPGLEHTMHGIKGLEEMSNTAEEENVFVHILDKKDRPFRNFYHGWNHTHGDMICYAPALPYKGEGTDFYAFYYEHFLRDNKLHGRSSAGALIQYWTPNKQIVPFAYANEVILNECEQRGIDVMFGWEMLEVKWEGAQKVAVFKNVDSGEVIEKDFSHANINPPSQPWDYIKEAGLADVNGGLDVCKYTLQHKKYENIFGMGDAVGFNTTRTMNAAMAQAPVVKNNVLRYIEGKDVNGVYDGYSYQPLILGNSYATGFSHTHDFEPTATNHWCPNYGLFAQRYFFYALKGEHSASVKYTDFKKNHGPPYSKFPKEYDELNHNEYLNNHGIPAEEVRHPAAQARLDGAAEAPASQ